MEDIKEQARKDVDRIWEEKLKQSFEEQINKAFAETLKDLKIEITNFNNSINNHIDDLDKDFEEKWNKKFENEMSKIEILKKQNNDKNNNEQNDFNNNEDINIINNKNNKYNDINDYKDYIEKDFNINNNVDDNDFEDDEKLRKKFIDFGNLDKPTLNYLTLQQNENPLINIILQCLSNIREVAQYFMNPTKENKILQKSKDNPNNTYLSPSFLKLLDHLWKSNQKEYNPTEIHNVLMKLMLNNYNTNDASIIINCILNKLNEELNFNQEYPNFKEDDSYEHFDRDVTLKKFQDKFLKNLTQISDTFFSTIKIKKRCLQCNHEGYQYFFEASPVVNIYLEENKENDDFNKLSFEEHFHFLLTAKKEENIIEDCLICGNATKKYQIKDVYTSSGVLIININREKDPNNKIYFRYPEFFDGKKMINAGMPNYQLTTVIKKIRNYNNNNFEYVAFYQNYIDKRWYSFNNQRIELIQDNYKNYIIDDKDTILLIYTKINN